MVNELFVDIIYQLRLLDKLIEKETNPIKRVRYEGMRDAFIYILEQEKELWHFIF